MTKQLKIILLVFIILNSTFSKAEENEKIYKLNLAHFLPRTSLLHSKFLLPWADKIYKETNGRLEVKIYPLLSLGGAPSDLIEQVRSGAAQGVWTVLGYTPDQFPKIEVFELPFVFNTTKSTVFNLAINDYFEQYLADEFKDFYVVLLHAHSPGCLHLKNLNPTTLDELKGKKIRIPNRIIGRFIEDIGAIPVAMPASDVYEGLNYGMLSGAMLPFEVVVPLRLHEQANYHLIAPFYTTVFGFLINKDFFDSLPKDIQEVVKNNSRSKIAYEVGQIWDQAEDEMMLIVKNQKLNKFYNLSQEETGKAIVVADKIAKEWKEKNGSYLYDRAQELLKKYAREQK